jgi:hypothetical protein
LAGFRSAIALPILLIFFGRRAVNFSAAQIIGGIAYAAAVLLFVSSTKLTTSRNAILLQYTAPLYVDVLSWWRGFRYSGQPFDRPRLPALDSSIPTERYGLDRSCAPWRVPDRAVFRLLCRGHQECDGHGEGILIPMLEPILNPLWALLFTGERIGPWALLGGVAVILSVLFRGVMDYRRTSSPI